MQVTLWESRTKIPFAAPSFAKLDDIETAVETAVCPSSAGEKQPGHVEDVSAISSASSTTSAIPKKPPRFSLQLLRSGPCFLLVELPTGDPFGNRDPGYLLLKDLLRAAGLPDTPQHLGEPISWPLLSTRSIDQGPQAAMEFLHSYLHSRFENSESHNGLWLIGRPALRFVAGIDDEQWFHDIATETLGAVWPLPGLDLLMEQPDLKRRLWQAMRPIRHRWKTPA